MKKKTLDQFINEASNVHNNFYDYSLVTSYTNTHTNINVICPIHGKFETKPYGHLQGRGCAKCAIDKRAKTLESRYGYQNPSQIPEVREKIKQTCLKNHGVEYPYQSKQIWDKRTQTCLKNHGVEHSLQHPDIRQRAKTTNLLLYGNEQAAASDIIRSKIKNTCLQRYNGNAPANSEFIKDKMKQTCLDRFGVINHSHLYTKDVMPLLTDFDWLYEQYVVNKKTAVQIAKELNINDVTVRKYLVQCNIDIRNLNTHSNIAIQWLESIIESDNIHIQHAMNGGEYQIPGTRYKADGYCQETNTIYEFHGDYWHGNPLIYESDIINESTQCTMGELHNRTLLKEQKIKELGYNLITIWESEWNDT